MDWDEGDPDVETEPSADPPVSQRGEVYALGRHRLMCGDSGDPADVAQLLEGANYYLLPRTPVKKRRESGDFFRGGRDNA